jgi:cyanophycin synthetase
MNDRIPIISVTGTKGKTTTVAVIDDVLRALDHNVLKVDTTGHFVNGERRSTLEESKASWSLVPSVCPGRYLWEFHVNPSLKENGVAVLECSLGCSGLSGMGYRYHDVGVFLNVFEDHLGSSNRIQSRADIAKAKEFIFSRIKDGGYAVFNADDELVVSSLAALPKSSDVTLVPVGLKFDQYDLHAHLENGGAALTVDDQQRIVLLKKDSSETIADLKAIPWTFDATFTPSVWNLLSAVGALYGFYEGKLPRGFREAVEAMRLDPYGGRLTLLKAKSGTTVLADYAHEKISIALVGDLARTKAGKGGRIIGVVRLAHDRTDELMRDTGRTIAGRFDEFIVYEKIDGYWRKAENKGKRFPQVVGRTSEIFAAAIAELNPRVTTIMREDEAIARAAEIARPEDVVVVIVNDNIDRSIEFIKESFEADFV